MNTKIDYFKGNRDIFLFPEFWVWNKYICSQFISFAMFLTLIYNKSKEVNT